MSTAPARIRVLCVDDHPVVRQGIAGLISVQTDIELVAKAANSGNFVRSPVGPPHDLRLGWEPEAGG